MSCPNRKFCIAKVNFKHYEGYCISDEFKNCPHYREYEMTPSQWDRMLGRSEKSSLF